MRDKVSALNEEDLQTQIEAVMVQVAEKDYNLRMENKRFWQEIATTHTYMFDRQEREIETLKTITVFDFQNHFTDLFYSPQKTKRIDFELTSSKHEDKQAEWATKNKENVQGYTHVEPAKRQDILVSVQAFKKSQALYPDFFKAAFSAK
jgi:secreted Zn-dependent insulinase-like peptidase